MKKFIVSIMLLLPLGMMAQEVKIAFVNTNDIFLAMPEVPAMESEIAILQKQYEDFLKGLNDEYTKKVDDLRAQQDSIPQNIQMIRLQEIQELETRMQNYYEFATQDRTKKQEELLAPIQEKIQKAINQVGEENGYTYIISPQALLYTGKGAIDATSLVKAKLGLN